MSVTAGLPSLLAYLGLGLLLGSSGAGIDFADADLALALGFAGLVLILAEGGLTTPWDDVRPSLGLGLVLATLGSIISIVVVSVGAHYLLDLRWELAVLLAAVLTPTDAAAVFSVLRTVPLRKSVTGTLEVESGLNDAPIVVLVVAISAGTHPVRRALGLRRGDRVRADRRRRHRPRSSASVPPACCAAWPCRRRACIPWSSSRSPCWRTARPPPSMRAASRPSTSPRSCWATPSCRTAGHPLVRRGHRLAGADRAVRHARPARQPGHVRGGGTCGRGSRPARS